MSQRHFSLLLTFLVTLLVGGWTLSLLPENVRSSGEKNAFAEQGKAAILMKQASGAGPANPAIPARESAPPTDTVRADSSSEGQATRESGAKTAADHTNVALKTSDEENVETGPASYYGTRLAGQPTASGEIFDPTKLTAAHPTLPMDSRVRVTNLHNDKSVVVRINDRGPFVGRRIIDLSRQAARRLGMIARGEARVRLKLLEE